MKHSDSGTQTKITLHSQYTPANKYSALKTASEVGEGFEVKCAGDLMGKDRCGITLQIGWARVRLQGQHAPSKTSRRRWKMYFSPRHTFRSYKIIEDGRRWVEDTICMNKIHHDVMMFCICFFWMSLHRSSVLSPRFWRLQPSQCWPFLVVPRCPDGCIFHHLSCLVCCSKNTHFKKDKKTCTKYSTTTYSLIECWYFQTATLHQCWIEETRSENREKPENVRAWCLLAGQR